MRTLVLAALLLSTMVGCGSVVSTDPVVGEDTGAKTTDGGGDTARSDSPASDSEESETSPPIGGGDRDAHGCIGSAGYQWCAKEAKCTRPWELALEKGFANTAEAFAAYCKE